MKIPFAKVDCSGNEARYVQEVLESGWLTTASKTRELESKFTEYLGCKHALAVNSCTSGLHLALESLGVGPGDGVFVPSLTFTASAEVIRYLGADPVVLDVSSETSGLTAEILSKAIEEHPNVKTLIAVHFGGMSLPMTGDSGIVSLCQKAGVRIVEDAAHALPTLHNGKLVGSFGDITVFSFYANKTMTTGEGGMVTTENDELAKRIKIMRLHGIDRDVWDRFTSESESWEYDVVAPGYKYNMPDLNAAVGLAQFERLGAMHNARLECATRYFERLSHIKDLKLPARPENMQDHSWHLFPIRLSEGKSVHRNVFIDRLNKAGIGTSVHYKPIHRLAYYKNRYRLEKEDFPNSEAIWQSTVSLPIYNLMTAVDVNEVCDLVEALVP